MAGHLRLGGVLGIGRPLGAGRKLLLLGTGRRASIRIARHRRGAGTRVARHRPYQALNTKVSIGRGFSFLGCNSRLISPLPLVKTVAMWVCGVVVMGLAEGLLRKVRSGVVYWGVQRVWGRFQFGGS